MILSTHKGVADKVCYYRSTVITGDCIDMVPYEALYDSEVVRLRNLSEARYFLNLSEPATRESQSIWRLGYEGRKGDIMWLIRDKSGRLCGTNRLYDINEVSAEKGSQIVDRNFARLVPAALESEIRIIDIAFDVFNVREVVATIRADNEKVKSMNNRLGFIEGGSLEISGIKYFRYVLPRGSWNPDPFKKVLAHWAKRTG